jgi:hypothetical protein
MHTLAFHESYFERPACVIALVDVRYSLEVDQLLLCCVQNILQLGG